VINETFVQTMLLELVQMDSPSLEEGEMAMRCRQFLENLGFTVEEDDAGRKLGGETGNLIATLAGNPDMPRILLAAHMDTVQPGRGIQPRVENGVIYSDGTTILGADDKAGITAIFAALQELVHSGDQHGDIQVLLTIAEEIGLQGAKNLDSTLLHSDFGLSLDSGGALGTLAVSGPAQVRFEIEVTGKSAHAGVAPEKGISAIKVAATAVSRMPHGRIDSETTVNVGSFVGQGPTNVVSDSVQLIGELRSRSPEKLEKTQDAIRAAFEQVAAETGATTKVTFRRMYDGFQHGPDSPIRKRIETALAACGFPPNPVKIGGGSDANIIQSYGLPILNIGIGYEEIHTLQEHIAFIDIMNAAKVAYAFCTMNETW
jgi:tripeptide aminopeptidase